MTTSTINSSWTIVLPSLLAIIVSVRTLAVDPTIVQLPKQGRITGRIVSVRKITVDEAGVTAISGTERVKVYLGIPYSAQPARFMPPTSPPGWEGNLTANEMKPVCPQLLPDLNDPKMPAERKRFIEKMVPYLLKESENCLHLNLYVPHEDHNRNRPYPVLVFIHGESLEWNSGNLYDGSMIASHGKIIFVSVNFRLGIFGFLKTDFSGKPNNFGLLDQIAALKWVRSNIEYFKGDPNGITVMGHGTGAACVQFLMLSPMAEGLFNRAILMSGSMFSALSTNANNVLEVLAAQLNCSPADIKNCLDERTDEEMKDAARNIRLYPFKNNFTPTVDGIIVLDSVREQMESPESSFLKYDLLAGVTELESYYLLEDRYLTEGLDKNDARKIFELYVNSQYEKYPNVALMMVLEEYIDNLKNPMRSDIKKAALEALSDALVTAPLLRTMKDHANSRKNSFFYVFGHPTRNKVRSLTGDDLPYVLGVPVGGKSYHYDGSYNSYEVGLSVVMMKYWSNFVKTGDPNYPDTLKYNWPLFLPTKKSSLLIDILPSITYDYRKSQELFWNSRLPMVERNCAKFSGCSISTNTVTRMTSENPFIEPPQHSSSSSFDFSVPTTMVADESISDNPAPSGEELNEATNPFVQESIAMFVAIGSVFFLIINLCIFFFVYRSRMKSAAASSCCLNRTCCTADDNDGKIAVLDSNNVVNDCYKTKTFITTDGSEDVYAARKNNKKSSAAASSDDYQPAAAKLASIKPEAMVGKRIKRWPLSRQCSGSTITMDPHTKVKEWIAQEIMYKCSPKHLRKPKESELTTVSTAAAPLSSSSNNNGKKNKTKKTKKNAPSSSEATVGKKRRKVSVAIDATAAARTASVLKQIPIELTKSLDEGMSIGRPVQLKPSSSLTAIPVSSKRRTLDRSCALSSEEYDDFTSSSSKHNVSGTHKTSATIRLKTPAIVREQLTTNDSSSAIADESFLRNFEPTKLLLLEDMYSRVDKKAKKKLKSFSTTDESKDNQQQQQHTTADNSVDSSGHYEDINVTSYREDLSALPLPSSSSNSKDYLSDVVKRRNLPKVLPDFPPSYLTEDNRTVRDYYSKRISLPYSSSVSDSNMNDNFFGSRIPPLPPPRLTSTLGKKITTTDEDRQLLSHLTVQLKRPSASANNKTDENKAFSSFSGSTVEESPPQFKSSEPKIIIKPSPPASANSSAAGDTIATTTTTISSNTTKQRRNNVIMRNQTSQIPRVIHPAVHNSPAAYEKKTTGIPKLKPTSSVVRTAVNPAEKN